VRTFKKSTQDFIEQRLGELGHVDRQRFGAKATLHVRARLSGDGQHRQGSRVRAAGRRRPGRRGDVIWNLDPSMGAEDFSFMLQKKPGAYLRLGQGRRRVRMLPAQHPATISTMK
jgi:hippurate hydrolase